MGTLSSTTHGFGEEQCETHTTSPRCQVQRSPCVLVLGCRVSAMLNKELREICMKIFCHPVQRRSSHPCPELSHPLRARRVAVRNLHHFDMIPSVMESPHPFPGLSRRRRARREAARDPRHVYVMSSSTESSRSCPGLLCRRCAR